MVSIHRLWLYISFSLVTSKLQNLSSLQQICFMFMSLQIVVQLVYNGFERDGLDL
jgi:Na+/glutamate symporter